MSDWFIIKNIEEFTNQTRYIVYDSFGKTEDKQDNDPLQENNKEELDNTLSYQESLNIVKSIVKKQKNRKTKKYRYILNEEMFNNIIQDLNNRMISNILNSLVNKGMIESSFDTDKNDFVFWVKE